MKILLTGSSGHLGEVLASTLKAEGHAVTGLDIVASDHTDVLGSINDEKTVRDCMRDMDAVIHTATLHKPHIATHSALDFVDTNVNGTLKLLEAATAAKVGTFIFTSTTSTFGDALVPPPKAPAAWITEDVPPVAKNIYGITKTTAEDLCRLYHRRHGLACVVLRTSRFFPEPDDDGDRRREFDDLNLKTLELLYRRVDIADVVGAHLAALARARHLGFGKFIISATSPFARSDLRMLRDSASTVLRTKYPDIDRIFERRGWSMMESIDRVYVNDRARWSLGWNPGYDFPRALRALANDEDPRSPLARSLKIKGYHQGRHADGLYPLAPPAGKGHSPA